MNWLRSLSVLILLNGLTSATLASEDRYSIALSVAAGEGLAADIGAQAKISFKEAPSELCLYLAFNDDNYYYDPAQSIHRGINQNKRLRPPLGDIEVINSNANLEYLAPHLIKITQPPQHLDLDYKFRLPQWATQDRKQKLFHGYYPQALTECPAVLGETTSPEQLRSFSFETVIAKPDFVKLTSPYPIRGATVANRGNMTTFSLTIGFKMRSLAVGGLSVEILYQNNDFLDYEPYFTKFIEFYQSQLGELPVRKLLLLESEELEKAGIPGIISINRPKQAGLHQFQNKFLNWGLWQLAIFTSQQWFGANIWVEKNDHRWLLRGMADYYANLALKNQTKIDNLLRYTDDQPWFRLEYSQSIDLLATLQKIRNPYNQILDENFRIYNNLDDTESFDYIRQFLLLRYLHWYLGDRFTAQLRSFYQKHRAAGVSYHSFYDHMLVENKDDSVAVSRIMNLWWASSTWPDLTLLNHSSQRLADGRYRLNFAVQQPADFSLDYDVKFDFSDGSSETRRFAHTVVEGEVILAKEPTNLTLNPGREIFDENRFDNSSRWPRLYIWPGSAATLYDDAYTFVWLPFFNKLPGEGFSLMLGLQLFRYLDAGMSIFVAHVPSEDRTGFNMIYQSKQSYFGLGLGLSAVQDYGPGLRDQRILEALLSKAYEPRWPLRIQFNLALRNRANLLEGANHSTYGLVTNLSTTGQRNCGFSIIGSVEKTIPKEVVSYDRRFILAAASCRGRGFLAGVRGFSGKLMQKKGFSSHSLFSPQSLSEARLRIDKPVLTGVEQISSLNLDFEAPFPLPLGSNLPILPKQSSLRLFFDYGESTSHSWRYQATGAGLRLPLGGDVVGKRSFAVGSLSLLTVFNRHYQGRTDTTPGFLIDFMGKL